MRTTLLVSCFVVVTMSAAIANQTQTSDERRWVAPAAMDAIQNPFKNQRETAAGGKKLFQQRCGICHRDDGTGTSRGPNLTTTRVQDQSDGAIFWKISSGNTRTGMPGFSFLPRAQRWQLVQHIRTLASY
jgi:mono/diheme cytochrome c family protein